MGGAACSLAYIFAFDLTQLYIIEFFFGASYAFQYPALLALATDISDRDRRGLFLGIFEFLQDAVGAVAALLSVVIVSILGFESLFFICSGCQATTGFFILKSRNVSR